MIALTQDKREELIALIEKSLPVMNAQAVMRSETSEFKKHIEIYEIALAVLGGNGISYLHGEE